MRNLDVMTSAYIETLLWSEPCRGTSNVCDHFSGDPSDCDISFERLNYGVGDVIEASYLAARSDVESFTYANEQLLRSSGLSDEEVGHNFALTRNGHGTGFWDRGLGEVGRLLSDACRPYGEVGVYVGDDEDRMLHIGC